MQTGRLFEHLRTVHLSVVGNLDCITFQKWSEAGHQMCFAICYTLPAYPTRTLLYDAAATITAATGWYPLVTGQSTILFPRKNRRRASFLRVSQSCHQSSEVVVS